MMRATVAVLLTFVLKNMNGNENQICGVANQETKMRRFVNTFRGHWIENLFWRLLSEQWCGNDHVPLDHRHAKFDDRGVDRGIAFVEDAHQIGLFTGEGNTWDVIMTRTAFHKIMRWYLRQWIFGEWFGLRRWLWYKILHRRCSRYKFAYRIEPTQDHEQQ